VKNILSTTVHTPGPAPLVFEATDMAAAHNREILQSYNNNISALLEDHGNSILRQGSEFRPVFILEPLLLHHFRWPKLKQLLTKGSNWPLRPIDDNTRKQKNLEFISRGNHKSAIKHEDILSEILLKEIAQGWMIPLPLSYIHSIDHAELAPVGIAEQWQPNQDGSRSIKYRLTHDQSFEASVGTSVNNRVITEDLDELFYGHCLMRLIHYIVSIRLHLPSTRILGCKTDFKAAYRRISLHGDTAARCCLMYKGWGLASSLRLTFGGSPCPNEFCVASETCADLANDLLHCPEWSPEAIYSPHSALLSPPCYLDQDILLGKAAPLDVSIPLDKWGRVDVFIDDGITIVPDIGDNWKRGSNAMPLAIHTMCRALSTDEPIRRDDPLSLSKFSAEGSMAEVLTILGWQINLRLLQVSLPKDKFLAWTSDITQIIATKKASGELLESLLGRLNHVAKIIPLSGYFLNRIRHFIDHTASRNPHSSLSKPRWLNKAVLEDISLFQTVFLPKAHEGISMNLITYRRPTHLLWSDAYPAGMGGFSMNTGRAWRFSIPTSS
jgi:hypothetical protein